VGAVAEAVEVAGVVRAEAQVAMEAAHEAALMEVAAGLETPCTSTSKARASGVIRFALC
jgi:hypothetical protein